jgi:hypothetical protein
MGEKEKRRSCIAWRSPFNPSSLERLDVDRSRRLGEPMAADASFAR